LRMLTAVESGGKRYLLRKKPSHTVFSNESCDEVREIMRLAARSGTGERLVQPLMEVGVPLVIGCKTGTTQKEPGTACSHLERACAEEKAAERAKKERKQPFDKTTAGRNCHEFGRTATRPHGRDCYTASMMAFGSVGDPYAVGPRAGEVREVMVFIVVDEPRGEHYYGSQIAGPAVMKVLQEALGLTLDGEPFMDDALPESHSVGEYDLELSEDPVLDALEGEDF